MADAKTQTAENPDGKKKLTRKQYLAAKKKKRQKIMMGISGAIVLICLMIWFGIQPLKAGLPYGICRTYIEMYVKYPNSITISEYDEFGASLRVFFTHSDAYGSQRSEMIECIFGPGPAETGGFLLRDVKLNQKSVPPEEITRMNYALPGIVNHEPNLVIPWPMTDDLMDLKRH